MELILVGISIVCERIAHNYTHYGKKENYVDTDYYCEEYTILHFN